MYEISDDDDSFNGPECSTNLVNFNMDTITISDDEDMSTLHPEGKTSAANEIKEEELPEIIFKQKKDAIAMLFPSNNEQNIKIDSFIAAKQPFTVLHIGGVKVSLPVKPYPSQTALMSKILNGVKKSENCLLQSPTGSGKTLALLCSVLSWQKHEQLQQSREQAQAFSQDSPLKRNNDVTDNVSSPSKQCVTPEKLFTKTSFGEKSIYEKTEDKNEPSTSGSKRSAPYIEKNGEGDESSSENLVTLHKRPRQGSVDVKTASAKSTTSPQATPEKNNPGTSSETPEKIRVPTIYYGARTHTQLQQVIKEFKRTSFCGNTKMSLLSSRDKSCIKELNISQWKTKNDMCHECIKPKALKNSDERKNDNLDTNCKFFDNRKELNYKNLPSAFDLEDLIRVGEQRDACPYYGARDMAKEANIVFCPYDYLLNPSIRNSLSIDISQEIIILDEAHNIENTCREAASFNFEYNDIRKALDELELAASYRYRREHAMHYIDQLVLTLKNWNDWFEHQKPLILKAQLKKMFKRSDHQRNSEEATNSWITKDFVNTLNNHNIGLKEYNSFKQNAEAFCQQLREDPRTLLGVTQATGNLLEGLCMVFGHLYRREGSRIDDYFVVLKRVVETSKSENDWRRTEVDQTVNSRELSLHLHCLNPGIVMESLEVARSIILASGTLTAMDSMKAELDTPFKQTIATDNFMSFDNVWVGAITGDENVKQQYDYKGISTPQAPERFGRLVLRVCELTPHGVLCFFTSYSNLENFKYKWRSTGVLDKLNKLKNVFYEQKNSNYHEIMMTEFYKEVQTTKGAILFAVYRGKVAEGMDFKDNQARAVICMGIPYPDMNDLVISAKKKYNDEKKGDLLNGYEWLRIQAFRPLNQAIGRCVRHKEDWGAVLLVDNRFTEINNTHYLSKWVQGKLSGNGFSLEALTSSNNGLATFMERMKLREEEQDGNID